MASSSSRKSNSSASNQKPTFRRSGSSSSVSRSGAIYRAPGSSADFGRDRRRTVSTRSGASYRPRLQAPAQRTANLARRGNVSIRKHANRPYMAPRPARPVSSSAFAPSRGTARPSGARSRIDRGVPHRAQRAKQPVSRKNGRGKKSPLSSVFDAMISLVGRIRVPSGRMGRIVAVALSAAIVFAVAAVVVLNSGLFAANDIQIKGSEHVSQEVAERLIDLPKNVTLFNVSDTQITDQLKKSPWVKGVDIKRVFPHTIVITPTERTVAAIVYLSADDVAWAVGDDGAWIAPVSLSVADTSDSEDGSASTDADDAAADDTDDGATSTADVSSDGQDSSATGDGGDAASSDGTSDDSGASVGSESQDDADQDQSQDSDQSAKDETVTTVAGESAAQSVASKLGVVLLTDVGTDLSPSSGAKVKSDTVLAALKYIDGFSDSFLKKIKYFSIPSVQAISINLNSGVEVSLGDATDIQKKERVVTKLLEQQAGVTYVNVRTPDNYTYRAAPL